MIFLLDTTALLVLSRLNITSLMLPTCEVLDVVVAECHHPKYLNAYEFVKLARLQKIESLPSWAEEASDYRSPRTSFQDRLNIYYAKSRQRVIITESSCLSSIYRDQKIATCSVQNFLQTLL